MTDIYIMKYFCTDMGRDRDDRDSVSLTELPETHGRFGRLTHLTINAQTKVSEAKLPLRIK